MSGFATPSRLLRLWFVIVLVGSLVLNLFVSGDRAAAGETSPARNSARSVNQAAAPTGDFELAGCSNIAGWAWDPSAAPNTVIDTRIYADGPAGSGTLLGLFRADIYRPDVVSTTGDNGYHGFSVPTPVSLKNGMAHQIYVYATNSATGGQNYLLPNSPRTIICYTVGQGSSFAAQYQAAFTRFGGSEQVGQPTDAVREFNTSGVYFQPFGGGLLYAPAIYHHQGSTAPANVRAFLLYGEVHQHYLSLGGPASALGVPTSDVFLDSASRLRANFANGYIVSTAGSGIQVYQWPTSFAAWKATYYNNYNLLSAPSLIRNENNTLNFNYDWLTQPPWPQEGLTFNQNWSAVWERTASIEAGSYIFRLCSDDGVRLYLAGQVVIDEWREQTYTCFEYSKVISSPTDLPVRIEYFQAAGVAKMAFTVIQANQFLVSLDTDNGNAATANSLSWALNLAGAGQEIIFSVGRVDVKGSLVALKRGAIIRASCTSPVTINGSDPAAQNDGLKLSGDAHLEGLILTGFRGKQLDLDQTTNNILRCMKIARQLPSP